MGGSWLMLSPTWLEEVAEILDLLAAVGMGVMAVDD
jgi:hypothetical protein